MAAIIKIVELLSKEGQELRFTIGLYAWNGDLKGKIPSKVALQWWRRAGLRGLGNIPACDAHEYIPAGSAWYRKTLAEDLADRGDVRALDELCSHWPVDEYTINRMYKDVKSTPPILELLRKHYGSTCMLDSPELIALVYAKLETLHGRGKLQ